MRRSLPRLRTLWLAAEALLNAVQVRRDLRRPGFRPDDAFAAPDSSGAPASADELRVCRQVTQVVNRVFSVLQPVDSCLPRALVAKRMLGARGIRAEVRIGVRPAPGGELDAHAWLVHGGRVILGGGTALDGYTALGRRSAPPGEPVG
jgi:hypothetical protein